MEKVKKEKWCIGHWMRRWLLAVCLLCCLFPAGISKAAPAAKPKIPEGVKAKGIDVSRYQGVIDWKAVKADGIDFAMVAVGYQFVSNAGADPQFANNMKGAIENGVDVGVYIYSHALNTVQAEQEADFVLKQIDGYKISYPIAFDIEDSTQQKLTTKQRTDITIAFLNRIEEAGYYPMIYASEYWFNNNMDLSRLTKYDKWVARWADYVAFKPLSIWQYSCTGRVKGINGDVDLDYDFRDYSKIVIPRTHPKERTDKSGWKTDGKHTWYLLSNGKRAKSCFKTIDGKRYFFDSKGYRVSGWKKIGGKYYFFGPKTGAMQKGWLKVSGKNYYLDKNGVRRTGWVTVDGSKYYLDKNGVRKTGWLTLKGKKYLLAAKSGRLSKGWTEYKGKTYYFSTQTGQMRKGWLTFGETKYYVKSNGDRAAGWTKIRNKWYYFNKKDGVMKRNCKVGKYKFDKNGVCRNYKK